MAANTSEQLTLVEIASIIAYVASHQDENTTEGVGVGVLLERARRALGGGPQELPPADPFELHCACGEQVSGIRHDERQFVACPRCGHVLFVLPSSPYPTPVEPQVAAPTGAEGVRIRDVARAPREPLGSRVRGTLGAGKRRVKQALWALVPPARWFAPVRLLIMAIVAAVIGTAALTVHLSRRGSLTGDIVAARAAWNEALEKGDFESANRELARATEAIRRYGSPDHESREIEHLAKQVALFATLLPSSLDETVRSLPANANNTEHFRSLGNPTLLVDSYISPNPTNPSTYRIENAMFVGNVPVDIDIANVRLFESMGITASQRVLFAARIETIERNLSTHGWTVRFVPDSAAVISSQRCLEKLAWPLDAATEKLLETQQEWALRDR